MTLGLFFYSSLIHYERFGGDPLKRSVKNRILAQMCKVVLVNSCFGEIALFWTFLIGPIHPTLAKIVQFESGIFSNVINLGFVQMVWLKNFLLFKFFSASVINEDFLAVFLTNWNWIFSTISQLSLLYLDQKFYYFAFLTGKLQDSQPFRTKYWAFFFGLTSILLISGKFHISFWNF